MQTKASKTNNTKGLMALAFIVFLSLLAGNISAQGFLRDDTVSTHTSGITVTEVGGFGAPNKDWDGSGSVSTTLDEFIEFTNTSNTAINISNWKLGDGSATFYIAPSGTILGPGKRVVIFMNRSGIAGPSTFNPGEGNICGACSTSTNGINNSGDGVGVANDEGRYIWIRFKTAAGSSQGPNANFTSSPTVTLGANTITETVIAAGASTLVGNGSGYLWNATTISGKTFNWSTGSATVTDPNGTPGRDTTGKQLELVAPGSSPTITFGTTTTATIPVTALGNAAAGSRRLIVVKQGSAVSFTPSDTVIYSGVNSNFTSASDQGSGNKIVYDDTATVNPVTVAGLSPSTTYHFAVYECNGNTPSSDRNYRVSSFTTGNATTAAPSTPTVNLSVSANAGTEAGTTLITVTATASSAVGSNQTVNLGVSGTGITAADYSLSNTTITILSGNDTGSVSFTVVNDTLGESTETATLTISSPSSGLTLGSTTTQNIAITDDEPTVFVSVSTSSTSEGGSTVSISAKLSAQLNTPQSVNVVISGSGVIASDYTLSGTSITIPANTDSGFVTLTIVDDAVREGTETFIATLSGASPRVSLGTPSSTNISVVDNDNFHSITTAGVTLPADTFDVVMHQTGSTDCYSGWYLYEQGSNANALYDTTSGGLSTGNTYSYGSFGSSERSLGTITTGSLTPAMVGVLYVNKSGAPLTHIKISYVGEQWRYGGATGGDKLDFQYSSDATALSNGTWTDVNTLDFNSPITSGTAGRLDGNASANRSTKTNIAFSFSTPLVNGDSVYLRFVDADIPGSDDALGIDSFVLTGLNLSVTNYYSKSTGDLDATTTWGTNTDGTGTSPNNFTDSLQIFNIVNNSSATIGSAWTVSGFSSKVILGNGSSSIMFTIPSASAFNGIIDVTSNSYLNLGNATLPTFGTVSSGSTIEYSQSSAITVLNSFSYHNLVLSGTGAKTISTGTTTVTGNISMTNSSVTWPSGTTTLNLWGDYTVSGSFTHTDTTKAWGIVTVGTNNQSLSGGGNAVYIFRLTASKSLGNFNLSNVNLRVLEDVRLNFILTSTYSDGGNTVHVGDDYQADGTDSLYNLTGTIVMRATTANGNIEQNTGGGTIRGKLNNVTWNLIGATGTFGGSSGQVYIKGNMRIESTNSGAISLGTNNMFEIKGDWTNNRSSSDVVTEGTSRMKFNNGNDTQYISAAFSNGETFYKLHLDNPYIFSVSGKLNITDSLILDNGVVTTNSTLRANGSVGRNNSWVNGTMAMAVATGASVSKSFHTGSTSAYIPVTLSFNSVTTAGAAEVNVANNATVGTFKPVCIDSNNTIDRVYTTAAVSGLVFSSFDGILTIVGADTTSGGASTQLIDGYSKSGSTVTKLTAIDRLPSLYQFSGGALLGTILLGESRSLTSSFTINPSNACLGSNVAVTYTGNGDNSGSYNWSFSGANVISGSGMGPYQMNWSSLGFKVISLSVNAYGCDSASHTDSIQIFPNGWTGAIDSVWNKPGNWCSGTVPTSSSNIYIPTGLTNYPSISYATVCNNINIEAGATLRIRSAGNLTVSGTYTNNGTLVHTSGKLILNTASNIPAASYHWLGLGGNGTYVLTGNITVNNYLVLSNASANLNTNGFNINCPGDVSNIGNVSGTGKLILNRAASYITVAGNNGTYGNVEVNSSGSMGARLNGNSTIIGTLTLTQGILIINAGISLTVGSTSSSTGNIVTTGGEIVGGSSSSTSLIKIYGNSSAPQITNLKISSIGGFQIDRNNGAVLGKNMAIRTGLVIDNCVLNQGGFNLTCGSTGTNLVTISGNGKIGNSGATGTLSVYGNASASAISSLKLDTVCNVNFNLPNGVVLGNGFYAKGVLSLANGDVALNGSVLTLGASGSISESANNTFAGNTGYITTSRSLTSSLSNSNIAGMGGRFTTNNAPGTTTIVRGHTVFSSGTGNSIKRYFGFVPANYSGLLTSFELNYDSSELNGADRSKLRMSQSNNSGSSWNILVGGNRSTTASTTGKVSRANISIGASGSWFTASDSVNSPLSPVVNNQQLAIGGQQLANNIIAYPNPFNSVLNLTAESNLTENTMLNLYDIEGRLLMSQPVKLNSGTNQLSIATDQLAQGIYLVQFGTIVMKVVKE